MVHMKTRLLRERGFISLACYSDIYNLNQLFPGQDRMGGGQAQFISGLYFRPWTTKSFTRFYRVYQNIFHLVYTGCSEYILLGLYRVFRIYFTRFIQGHCKLTRRQITVTTLWFHCSFISDLRTSVRKANLFG